MIKLLKGEEGPCRDVVLMNSAAGVIVGGKASDLKEGLEVARESIDSGKAYEKLQKLIKETGGDVSKLEALEGRL